MKEAKVCEVCDEPLISEIALVSGLCHECRLAVYDDIELNGESDFDERLYTQLGITEEY